jgi:hypothetical protein
MDTFPTGTKIFISPKIPKALGFSQPNGLFERGDPVPWHKAVRE